MSKGSSFVIFVVILIILFNILSELLSTEDGIVWTSSDSGSDEIYGLRPLENSWPAIGQSPVALANNLLAANYYVILDGSGSMANQECSGNKSKLDAAKEALAVFVAQLPSGSNIGLYVFDAFGRKEVVSLSSGTKDEFLTQVNNAVSGSGTPLYSSVVAGYEALKRQAGAQLGYGEYHLVVVTDGEANDGEDPRPAVKRLLQESPVQLHTIGFCIGDRHSLNQPGLVDYRAADDPQSLARSLEAVLAEAPKFDVGSFKEVK